MFADGISFDELQGIPNALLSGLTGTVCFARMCIATVVQKATSITELIYDWINKLAIGACSRCKSRLRHTLFPTR